MSTKPSSAGDGSVLGDSWVVASTHLPAQYDQRGKAPQDATNPREIQLSSSSGRKETTRTRTRSADSMGASTSSSSGPELIMPSISDTLMLDGSWVAPDIRAGTQSLLKQRPSKGASENSGATTFGSLSRMETTSPSTATRAKGSTPAVSHRMTLTPRPNILRWTLNLIMITTIMHLLVLPELAHQYQSLCRVPAIAQLYPSSCVAHDRSGGGTTGNRLPHEQVIITWHTQLQDVLESALQDMTSSFDTGTDNDNDHHLKQTESDLRDIHTRLKRTHSDGKHELDLEFRGCWQALRAARGELASLKSDMRSAIESLARSKSSSHGPDKKKEGKSDPRQAAELSHREQYLARLVDGMHSKAGSLRNLFATMDDHLDSIRGVSHRRQQIRQQGEEREEIDEERTAAMLQSWPWTFLDTFARSVPDAFRPYFGQFTIVNREYKDDDDGCGGGEAVIGVTERLDEMIQRHRDMMRTIDDLTTTLQRMQKERGN